MPVGVREPRTGVHPGLPSTVKAQIERALDTELTSIVRQPSGVGGRSFLLRSEAGQWIARIEHGATQKLKTAMLAQSRAGSVGVSVPAIVAAQVDVVNRVDYRWAVEEYLRGSEFYPERIPTDLRKATSADIGRQLKLLHTVELDSFGHLRRDPRDARQASWADWIDQQQAGVEAAVRIAGCRPADARLVEDAYRVLRHAYADSPRLCHGDFSDDNLLVENGSLIGVIDWEGAHGGDPAGDVAYWFVWHGDLECLDALLAGYAPTDPGGFRRRVAAHRILAAVKLICWFNERRDHGGLQHCRRILTGLHARMA